MTTNIPSIATPCGAPWRRLLSCLAILLTAGTLPAATVIDNFDEPNGGTEVYILPGGGNGSTHSEYDPGIGVWGGERQATLTRTSNGSTTTIAAINKLSSGVLTYDETPNRTSELELEYGTDTLSGADYEVLLDIPYIDPLAQPYQIDLTVKAFNAVPGDPFTATPDEQVTQSLIVQNHGDYLGGTAYSLGYDLSSNHFQNLHSYFNGSAHIAFSLMFYASNDADITLESILLQAINGGGGPDVVPEPSTYALGLTSMLGLFYYGYRRRRRAKC